MSECPFCHRRLLSTSSPACNWCGKEIPDAAYQQRAATQREAISIQRALHDAAELAAIEGMNMGGFWASPLEMLAGGPFPVGPMRRPLPPLVYPAIPDPAPPAPVKEPEPQDAAPEEPTEARFRHLEL